MSKKTEPNKDEPTRVFRNRTKIDQVVYDHTMFPITVPPGKTIRGDYFAKYAGEGKPFHELRGKAAQEATKEPEKPPTTEEAENAENQDGTDGKSKE